MRSNAYQGQATFLGACGGGGLQRAPIGHGLCARSVSITQVAPPFGFTITNALPTAASAGHATWRGGGGLQVRGGPVGSVDWQLPETSALHVPSSFLKTRHVVSSVASTRFMGRLVGTGGAVSAGAGGLLRTTGGDVAGVAGRLLGALLGSAAVCIWAAVCTWVTATGSTGGAETPGRSAHPAKPAAVAAKVATNGVEKLRRGLLAGIAAPLRKQSAGATAGEHAG
jgi:hypothetical protein